MSVAAILRYSANVVVGAILIKLVAGDMASEVRRDMETLQSRTNSVVWRSPYRIAGAVTAMGVVAGMLLAQLRHHRA
jgi:ElaB/YqjD/DUF883 family membrane-anchored ribosome-binding protein